MSRRSVYDSILPDFSNEDELQFFLDKTLTEACVAGDTDQVIDLLQKGASVNGDAWIQSLLFSGENFMTPLMNSAMQGCHQIVKLLLENDADPNKGDRYHVTALHCAALSGHDKCVALLIDAGANVNAATLNYDRIGVHQKPHRAGTTPLHLASKQNHPNCIEKLLRCGKADINKANVLGLTALNIACQSGNEESVLALIACRKKDNLNTVASQVTADTTLHHCVRHGMLRGTRELLRLGMDVNQRNAAGFTPLHFAVVQDSVSRLEMLKILFEEGHRIDVNIAIGDSYAGVRNRVGRKGTGLRALHLVAFAPPEVTHHHEVHTVEYHLSREFVTTVDPRTPVRDVECASLLIEFGADISVCYNGRTLMEQEIYTQSGKKLLELLTRAELKFKIPERPKGITDELIESSDALWKIRWLKILQKTPPSLQHCCRCKVRSILTPVRLNCIRELPIPLKLKDFLLLKY